MIQRLAQGNISFEEARSRATAANALVVPQQDGRITTNLVRNEDIGLATSPTKQAALLLKVIGDVTRILNSKVGETTKAQKYPYELSDYQISQNGIQCIEDAARDLVAMRTAQQGTAQSIALSEQIKAHNPNTLPEAKISFMQKNGTVQQAITTIGEKYQPDQSLALSNIQLSKDPSSWTDTRQVDISEGKVRTTYWLDDKTGVMIARDTTSAMDIPNLCDIPGKGAILTGITNYWLDNEFKQLAEGLGMNDHRVAGMQDIDPNVTYVNKVTPLPIEIVLRKFITGSAFKAYNDGLRIFGSHKLPNDVLKNDQLNTIIVDPTIKGRDSDIRISDGVASNLVGYEDWQKIKKAAITLFQAAELKARSKGLLLVDTKFEFGKTADGKLVLIDEVLTPDSSRYWTVENYFATLTGQDPVDYSKEPLRDWVKKRDKEIKTAHSPNGEAYLASLKTDKTRYKQELGEVPVEVVTTLAQRYATIYSALTGQEFKTDLQGANSVQERIEKNLRTHNILAA